MQLEQIQNLLNQVRSLKNIAKLDSHAYRASKFLASVEKELEACTRLPADRMTEAEDTYERALKLLKKLFALAIQNKDIENARDLLATNCCDLNYINHTNTPLTMAAFLGDKAMVEFLLSYPVVRMNEKTEQDKYSAIMWAAREGHTDIVKLLADKGAELNNESENPTMQGKRTPLYCAAKYNRIDTVRYLLEKNVDTTISFQGSNAFQAADKLGYADVARLLREHRDKSNPLQQAESLIDAATRLTQALQAAKEKHENAQKNLIGHEQELQRLESEIDMLNKRLVEKQKQFAEQNKEVSSLEIQLEKAKHTASLTQGVLSEMTHQKNQAGTRVTGLKRRIDETRDEVTKEKINAETQEKALQDNDAKREKVMGPLEVLLQKNIALKAQVGTMRFSATASASMPSHSNNNNLTPK